MEPLHDTANVLHSVAIHLLRTVRQSDTETGLSPSRLSALSVIVFAGPLRLGKLANIEQVKPPSMTKLVEQLEKSGFAVRKKDPADERAWLIEATQKGTDLLLAAKQKRIETLTTHLSTLDEAGQKTVADAVALLKSLFLN